MNKNKYETPVTEVIKVQHECSILSGGAGVQSYVKEDYDEWGE